MSADLAPFSWRVEREVLGIGSHMPTVRLHQTAGGLMFSSFIFLTVSFSLFIVHFFSRSLLIPFCVSLYCLCVFPSCRHLFPGSEGNKCMRFQRLILLLRTGEPNMWGQLWKEGDTGRERERECVWGKGGAGQRGGVPATDGRSWKQGLECVCCCWGGGGWQVVETWDEENVDMVKQREIWLADETDGLQEHMLHLFFGLIRNKGSHTNGSAQQVSFSDMLNSLWLWSIIDKSAFTQLFKPLIIYLSKKITCTFLMYAHLWVDWNLNYLSIFLLGHHVYTLVLVFLLVFLFCKYVRMRRIVFLYKFLWWKRLQQNGVTLLQKYNLCLTQVTQLELQRCSRNSTMQRFGQY